jgi:hypothetical protein
MVIFGEKLVRIKHIREMLKKQIILLLILTTFIFLGCKKESDDQSISGTIRLNVLVKHHNVALKGIPVYLKSNAESFPGRDAGKYDISTSTDASGKAEFNKLFPGNYYLYAYGWDALVADSVWGYKEAVLNNETVENNEITVGIAVSE